MQCAQQLHEPQKIQKPTRCRQRLSRPRQTHPNTLTVRPRAKSCPSYRKVHHLQTPALDQDTDVLDAHVTKRPLPRPALSSPYAGPSDPKIVYVSAKTPFLSAVKRVEKLLHLADKRAVQSATTEAKKALRKRKRGDGDADEIGMIAGIVEDRRNLPVGKDGRGHDQGGRRGERVMIKGTGKAVQKVLELGLWFQQRDGFEVRLRTGTVGAVDDVEVGGDEEKHGEDTVKEGEDTMDVDDSGDTGAQAENGAEKEGKIEDKATSGARIRYLSVLEVTVSLR